MVSFLLRSDSEYFRFFTRMRRRTLYVWLVCYQRNMFAVNVRVFREWGALREARAHFMVHILRPSPFRGHRQHV